MNSFYVYACEESKEILEEFSFFFLKREFRSDLFVVRDKTYFYSAFRDIRSLSLYSLPFTLIPVNELRTYLQMISI